MDPGEYGYTAEDFRQTITEMPQREKVPATDIVEAAIAKLEGAEQGGRNRTGARSRPPYRQHGVCREPPRGCSRDSLITIREPGRCGGADPAGAVGRGCRQGRYNPTIILSIRSTETRIWTNRHALLTDDSLVRSSSTLRMLSGRRIKHNVVLSGGGGRTELAVKFGNYPEKPKRMHLTIDSLVVVYQPPLEEARRVLLSHEYGYRLMIDDREYEEYYARRRIAAHYVYHRRSLLRNAMISWSSDGRVAGVEVPGNVDACRSRIL